jgi:hypothetical protein
MGRRGPRRDPRLGRDVAIKVLPPSFSADADRLRHFEQEARAGGVLRNIDQVDPRTSSVRSFMRPFAPMNPARPSLPVQTSPIALRVADSPRDYCASDFWSRHLDDGRDFADIVRDPGIVIQEHLDYIFGMGLQGSYGGLSAGKAGRLFGQWQRGPERFEDERPRRIVDAVMQWGRDAEADEIRAREAWDRCIARLPTPPPGYFWHLMTGGVGTGPPSCWFMLWSHELGYPPVWE